MQALFGQLLVGLINGSFYALLSLGLAIIFGLLNIVNFSHGALYMTGAFVAWFGLERLGIGYWGALLLSPIAVGLLGVVIERTMLRRLYQLDNLYGLLLTFGLTLIIEGIFHHQYGNSGNSYPVPEALQGGANLGFMFLPRYRAWVVVVSVAVCFASWFVIERTKLGSYLRAGTENPRLLQAFGVNVPLMFTLTFGFGVALAGFAGVMAAPIYQVSPSMGSGLIIVVFAVVVIGGMGIDPRVDPHRARPRARGGAHQVPLPAGRLHGGLHHHGAGPPGSSRRSLREGEVSNGTNDWRALLRQGVITPARKRAFFASMFVLGALLPFAVYPVFLMNVLCMALFASAFNLLLGYTGLLSFGHAAFLASAGYVTGHAVKVWGLPPEVGVLAGVAVATGLGFVIGGLAIRRSGIYFAMITLGFAQMIYFLAVQLPFTGGEDGLQGIPRGRLFGLVPLENTLAMYYFTYAIFIVGFYLVYRTIHSPFGHVLRSIRENEPRALSLGYDVDRYKLVAFVISAGLAGLAGSTKALVLQFETLTDAHWHKSGEVVLMTLLGGMGTVMGPSVGALLVVTMDNYLSGFGDWVTVIIGCVFVAGVLAFRRGFVGEALHLLRKFPF